MKPFVELECNNITIISQEIYNFLKEKTDIIETAKPGWHLLIVQIYYYNLQNY